MRVYLDIETDGLLPTKIWCCCARDSEGGRSLMRSAGELQRFLAQRPGATLYAHNGIRFDYPVLTRLWGIDFSGFVLRDTLVLSYLSNPSREGGHSLAAWGQRLGFAKGDHSDWSYFSVEMGVYCLKDTEILQRVADLLEKEELSPQAVELEHNVARIIFRQVQRGFMLNREKCALLVSDWIQKRMALEDEVHARFRPLVTKGKLVTPKYTKDGSMSKVGLGEFTPAEVGGPFTRVTFPEFNLGSRQQVGRYLQWFGWKPEKFTDTGSPIVDEAVLESLDTVDIPEAKLIAEYFMLTKRIAMAQSWLEASEADGRVHGDVVPCGAVTGRMTHRDPNLGQIPARKKPYGKECRELFMAQPGYKLVGCDAEGLELRTLAHYMKDPEYAARVISGKQEEGTDVHTTNQMAAGLPTRDAAKTFIYAFLYGAGDAKIGSIVGGSAAAGKKLKSEFLKKTPALAQLRDRVQTAANRGWLVGIDGRRLWVRSSHAALNTLLQGAGAVLMKQALVLLDYHITKRGLDAHFVVNVHDEFQLEVAEKDAETVAWLAASCIAAAGKQLGFSCPMAGKSAIGNNWAETH